MTPPKVDIKVDLRGRLERGSTRPSRLISIIPVDNADGTFDLIYMFQGGEGVEQYRYTFPAEEELDTISDLFKGALNMERENTDLFGLRFKGVPGGLLIMPGTGIVAPLRKSTEGQKEAPKDG
jgi:NADH:ubiquinone oxidoreductase subunit C